VMEPHLFRIAPQSGSGESYTHEGEEFLYILQGELQISLQEEEYRLRPGDSFYFESHTPHRWINPGRDETWVLWVNTPPTF
jgi:quercetin dioxygenase-like cupin family protein